MTILYHPTPPTHTLLICDVNCVYLVRYYGHHWKGYDRHRTLNSKQYCNRSNYNSYDNSAVNAQQSAYTADHNIQDSGDGENYQGQSFSNVFIHQNDLPNIGISGTTIDTEVNERTPLLKS